MALYVCSYKHVCVCEGVCEIQAGRETERVGLCHPQFVLVYNQCYQRSWGGYRSMASWIWRFLQNVRPTHIKRVEVE